MHQMVVKGQNEKMILQGFHPLVKMKFKDFSRTFKDVFQ